MLPEPNFPVKPDEFIGRRVHLGTFSEAVEHSRLTGRMASFAVLGDWGIGKSSLLLKLAGRIVRIPNASSQSFGIEGHL